MLARLGVVCAALAALVAVAPASAQLYGLRGGAGSQLLQVDPKTGAETPVGPPHPHEYDAQGLASVDNKKGIFYFVSFNSTSHKPVLLGQNLKTGAFDSVTELPFPEGGLVGVGQTCTVDQRLGVVYVTGPAATKGDFDVYRVVPGSGKKPALLKTIKGVVPVLGGASAFDEASRVLWLMYGLEHGGINLFGIDAVVGHLAYNISNEKNMETMAYDESAGRVVGIGLAVHGSAATRIVVALDSRTGKQDVVCDVKDLFVIDGGHAGYDQKTRTLYAYLAKKDDPKTFYLASIHATTCATTLAPGCTNAAQCPWNLGYFNQA